ncbi:MAG: AraC family transcriptional regulator, partial [Microbacterium sp.]
MVSGVSADSPARGSARRFRARLRRTLAAVASVAVVATGLVALDATDADALTLAAPSIIYQADVNGDYILVGNGVLRWNGAAVQGAPTANQLHNGTAGSYYNDHVVMGNNTVADLPTAVNGSSATLTIPAGAQVARAQLSWAGNLGELNGTAGAYCSANGAATLPASGAASTQSLQLKVGADSVRSVAPGSYYGEAVSAVPSGNPNYYSASQDVTAIFRNAIGVSNGATQTVSVGDIWVPNGAGCFGGWSLTVVYDFGQLILGNAASTGRNVVLYSGHVRQATTDPAVVIDFGSFETLDTNSRVGVTLYEGDRNITGDTVSWRAGTSGGFTALPNASGINTTNNYGISVADGSVRYAGNGTGAFFNASVDARSQAVPLPTGTKSMQLQLATNGDSYLWQNAVLSTASAHVSIRKEALDGTDTQAVNPGGTPSFRITVSNNGSTALGSFAITDPLAPNCARPAGSAGLPTSLASAASFSYTCTGPTTSTGWTNSATVNAVASGGSNRAVSATDTTVVTVTRIGLVKSGTVPANATAGQFVTYTFTATNTGTSPLSGVTITDPKPGLSTITYGTWPSGTAGVLGPGQSVTATATYPLTQADINSGSVANTASVAATGPNSTSASATAPATVSISANPLLTLAKSGVLNGGGTAITYTFTVANVGNLPLTGVAITDPMLTGGSIVYGTWPSGTAGTLAPGETVTATATYPVTQANTNAGSVANTATVTGTPPRGTAPTATASATVPIPRSSAIVTTKSGALAVTGSAPRAGDLVTYTFTARNAGNTTLTGVTIADPMPGLSPLAFTWPGPAGTLQPGQTVTATATYALTQADIDAGSVVNTATGSATSPTGPVSSPATTTLPLTRAPAIALTKSGAIGGAGAAGDTVTYTFSATNTGNTTLTAVGIADPMTGLSALTYTWPGAAGTLRPGQTVTATATYTLTQADVNAGSVVNTATATGSAPGGATVTASRPATVPIPQGPAIRLTKTGVLSGASGAGGTVTFTFVVRNTGNVTLGSVGVTDQLSGLSAITFGTWPGATGTLDPGQSVTGTATYTVTQADADRGSVSNNATARGTSAQGTTVTGPGTVTVPIAPSPAIALDKTGALNGTGKAGDTITYTFTVRNSGTVTLTGVSVTDPKVGGAVALTGWPGAAGVLAPGQTATGTATHTLTQAEVNAGVVNNTASAAGTPPAGGSVTTTDSASVTIPSAPAIQLVKSASPGAANRAGDVVTYSFTITNRGNVTLTGVGVTDPLPGLGAITWGAWPGGVAGTLQPNASVTATASYTVTQSDVNAGSVVNSASATGTPPVGAAVTATDPEVVPIPRNPAMTFTKTGALAGTGRVGDVVTYTFHLTNSGNVTLTGVGITDPLPNLSAIVFGTWPGAAGTLLPSQSVQATATYTLTQADVDRGRVDNLATAVADPPSGAQLTRSDDATVPVTAAPAIEVVKDGTRAGGATPAVGDIVTYTFDVTNRGNVTLDEITVTDPKPGLSTITFGTWPGAAGELAPGATVRATATYALTQADVDAGTTTNTATARGLAPSGAAVTDTDGADVPLTAAPAIQLEKDGALAGDAVAGDEVTYTFVLTNTGNVTLSGVNLRDPLLSANPLPITGWPGTAGQLRPGASVTVTAQHVLTQADIDAGSIVNTATATGTPPRGAAVSDADGATVALTGAPAITLDKTVRPIAAATAGTVVTYDFTVVNTGAVTLSGVAVADALPGISGLTYQWPGAAGILAPGAQVRATATYPLTQADVDAGSLVNEASVSGTPPTGPAVTDDDDAPLTLPSSPRIDIAKSHTVSGSGVVGDVITYRFTVQNTGNVTLTGVTAADPLDGLTPLVFPVGWDGVLSPAEVVVATATYTLTQADVDAGSVVNTASASGTPPVGAPVSDTGADTVTMPFGPAITVEKAGSAGGANAGDVVTYSFEIRNSGNLTLTDVTLDDPKLGGPLTITGWPGAPGTLAPAEVATATATYTLTQADADAGFVSNTATTTGVTPGGTVMTDSDDVVVPLSAEPEISLTKSGALASGAAGVAGDIVTYTFTVRNTGNVTLSDVDVADPLTGLSAITLPATWPSGTAGVLAPGDSVQATATYTLTQADVNRGFVDNTATATGTPPTGDDVADTGSSRLVVAAAPRLQVVKTGVLSAGDPAAGSTIVYTFQLANLGNVTLTGITLDDGLAAIGTVPVAWPGAVGTLQPGQTATGTATYTVTQADLDSGAVVNTASASGAPPVGAPVAGSDIETVPLVALPSIEVVKSASGAVSEAGDVVSYGFVVRNTGNVTL